METTSAPSAPHAAVQRSNARGYFDHGWLQTYHSFSFADYYDPQNVHWGALRVFNDDVIAPGRGFGTHPHRDMEILTYVLDGELEHRDSMGNVGIVRPGGVQYVSAGTGIAHSEFNHSKTAPVRLVQMWVLPRARGLRPQYGQVDYTMAERQNRWLTIASGDPNVDAKISIWQDATAAVARLESTTLSRRLENGRFGFLFVADGEVTANGTLLGRGDALRLKGTHEIMLTGSGELVYWDVPPAAEGP
ncbi:MAG: pirin family protein [Candidatus Eremiobacteraeota bacterium]|nr:pirin family protein [Candidatus Eremiobacteraeota bacterium]MBV9646812.1 pirin family protein [Candidatus Eremiobacteraeota bacterium]